MSAPQRTLLVLLGLLALGGTGALLVVLGDGEPGPESVDGPLGPPRRTPPSPGGEATPLLASSVADRDGEREGVLQRPGSGLVVLVTDEGGRSLPQARVRLEGDEGLSLGAQGSGTWDDIEPGEWVLVVQAEGMLTHRETITVTEGQRTRHAVRLSPHLTVEGEVVNRFGEPMITTLWFLEKGQTHPREELSAEGLASARTDGAGHFTVHLPAEGDYRVSAGPPGMVLGSMSRPQHLYPGGPRELSVVLAGGTRLEIALLDPPEGLAAGKVDFRVAILGEVLNPRTPRKRASAPTTPRGEARPKRREGQRRQGGQAGPEDQAGQGDQERPKRQQGAEGQAGGEGETRRDRKARGDGEGRRAKNRQAREGRARGRRGNDQEGGEPGPGRDPADRPNPVSVSDAPQTSGPADADLWRQVISQRLSAEGRAVFDKLPAGRNLRLSFLRRSDQYRSTTSFTLLDGLRTRVRFGVPPRRSKEAIQAEPVLDLAIIVETLPPEKDAPEPGFHWR